MLNKLTSIITSEKSTVYDVPGDQRNSRLDILFTDSSRLIARNMLFYDTGWEKYSYQWMSERNELIHRWDNAHEVPGIPTSPYHQHVGSEENVLPSEPMTLEKVLAFIATRIVGPEPTSD